METAKTESLKFLSDCNGSMSQDDFRNWVIQMQPSKALIDTSLRFVNDVSLVEAASQARVDRVSVINAKAQSVVALQAAEQAAAEQAKAKEAEAKAQTAFREAQAKGTSGRHGGTGAG